MCSVRSIVQPDAKEVYGLREYLKVRNLGRYGRCCVPKLALYCAKPAESAHYALHVLDDRGKPLRDSTHRIVPQWVTAAPCVRVAALVAAER